MKKLIHLLIILFLFNSCIFQKDMKKKNPIQISGIHPHLAYYNNEKECGTGAVVPWANRLWVVTYGPHQPFGSSDKLYEITSDLNQIIREESIGGTPANRMIHKESNQLFIGPYVIDSNRNVRVIPYEQMPGRHTGNARHLFNPTNEIYYGTMEEGFYDVDVNTLKPTMIYTDGNVIKREGQQKATSFPVASLDGVHGKGLYSGQGVLVYSNNGEPGKQALEEFDIKAGSLSEWDGKKWKQIRRNQFVEITGPGGIYGNKNLKTDAIWTTGWDHKSIILGVRSMKDGWNFFRLPIASHSYDGAHGWNTEWPRIRDIGTYENPDFLMTMHGMFWHFPETFTTENSSGIRPRSAYLKVIGDFARWNDQVVFGCDDSAQNEFLNKRKQKGEIGGPGQSNSNLWFTNFEKLNQLGPNTASGAVWLNDEIKANEPSEPMLFTGWSKRSAWIKNQGSTDITFTFEIDKEGNQVWSELKNINVKAGETFLVVFNETESGEWIRVKTNAPTVATISFNYANKDNRPSEHSKIFNGVASINNSSVIGGLMYGLGDNRRSLGVSAVNFKNGVETSVGYYELDETLNLIPKDDNKTNTFIKEKFAIPENVIEINESSILIIDDKNLRWRLPIGHENFKNLTDAAQLRIAREVATERDLFNACGTFYELPAENADGFAKIRPIASHDFRIHDYASYRGMLVMTGIDPRTKRNEHIIFSKDKKAAVWLGTIDDLWEAGKPIGKGGPWKNSNIKADEPSDPYLIGFYDKRSLEISHKSKVPVKFKIEVEPIGHGPWMLYKEVTIQPGETFKHVFPEGFEARWIRFIANINCEATAWLEYS